ncbi:MAG: SDR family oxidoreductase [Stenotrophobium sp.]
MTQLAGKVVWITGASGGIGEALALDAAARGAKLVLSARRAAQLERVRALCPDTGKVAVLPLDLLDFDASAAAAQAEKFFGPVDILVNNAGATQRSLALDTDMAVYRQLMELNYFASVALTRALLPGMVARKSGHVVMVSSVAGKFGAPLRSGYCAAKHALNGFTEAARAELWRDGVHFTTACPGFVKTQISVNALNASGGAHGKMDEAQAKGMEPRACAQKIWNAVAANREEVLIGMEAQLVHLKRLSPALFSQVIKRAKVT